MGTAHRQKHVLLCSLLQLVLSTPTDCDDCTSVDLLQRQLHVRGEERQPNATMLRLKSALPMVWIHVPKCGTSFANTLFGMPNFCPSISSNFDVEDYSVNGSCYYKLFDSKFCQSMCDPEFLYCLPPLQFHLQVGNESEYAARKGRLVGMFRQPEQRLLSAFYDGHAWVKPTTLERCDLSHQGEYPILEFAEYFKGTMAFQLASPEPPAWGRLFMLAPRTMALGFEAAKRLREGFAFVGILEEWDLSICLFHAMFGGACHSSEFHNVHKGPQEKAGGESYDTSILEGFQDEIDGLVYAEAVQIFKHHLELHNVSQESCQPCFAQAGLYD